MKKNKIIWLVVLIITVGSVIAMDSYVLTQALSSPSLQPGVSGSTTRTAGGHQSTGSTSSTATGHQTADMEIPTLTALEVQTILQREPMFKELPSDAVIVLAFFDRSNRIVDDLVFTVSGGGAVTKGFDPDYDFKLSTTIGYIENIKSTTDTCAMLNKIKNEQNFLIDRQISTISAMWKYNDMMEYGDCLGV